LFGFPSSVATIYYNTNYNKRCHT